MINLRFLFFIVTGGKHTQHLKIKFDLINNNQEKTIDIELQKIGDHKIAHFLATRQNQNSITDILLWIPSYDVNVEINSNIQNKNLYFLLKVSTIHE